MGTLRWSGVGCIALGLCAACTGDARDPSPPGHGEPSSLDRSNVAGGTASESPAYAGHGGGFSAQHREVGDACPNEHPDDFCFVDADCRTGGPCLCSGQEHSYGWNICLDGNCWTDADCGDLHCSPTLDRCGISIAGYYCRTPDDDCADCPGDSCTYNADAGHWGCNGFIICDF